MNIYLFKKKIQALIQLSRGLFDSRTGLAWFAELERLNEKVPHTVEPEKSNLPELEIVFFKFWVIGTGETGSKWIIIHEEETGSEIEDLGRGTLARPDYGNNHRCTPGKKYEITLIPGSVISDDCERTGANMSAFACRQFGKSCISDLKAELVFLIRRALSFEKLLEMGIKSVVVLHPPIIGPDGNLDPNIDFDSASNKKFPTSNLYVLYVEQDSKGSVVQVVGHDPNERFSPDDYFAVITA